MPTKASPPNAGARPSTANSTNCSDRFRQRRSAWAALSKQFTTFAKKQTVMISDRIIKKEFIARTIRGNMDEVRRIQIDMLNSADERIRKKFDIDAIVASVEQNTLTVAEHGDGLIFSRKIIKKLRFLDMKRLGNMKLYNRLVWGLLYGETKAELSFGFSEEIKNALRRQLEAAGFK
jgi:hypothetical protein